MRSISFLSLYIFLEVFLLLTNAYFRNKYFELVSHISIHFLCILSSSCGEIYYLQFLENYEAKFMPFGQIQ